MPRSLTANDQAELIEVLNLIQTNFAYMNGRIDPPSSMHRLNLDSLCQHCRTGEIWTLGRPVQACLFLSPRKDCLYLGKLAVAEASRERGLARQLVEIASRRAQELGLAALELQSRIELVENHRAFARLGFKKTAETAHPGYEHATSITMRYEI